MNCYFWKSRRKKGRFYASYERRKNWQPRQNDYQADALWRYAQNAGPAYKGAVTHPEAKAETHVYADI